MNISSYNYYHKNKEKIKEARRKRLLVPGVKEMLREQRHRHYLIPAVREKIIARAKEYRLKNIEKVREQRRQYRLKNKEKIREQRKQYGISPWTMEKRKKWKRDVKYEVFSHYSGGGPKM